MGDYTGVSFRLPVKKDTPQPVIDFLDHCFYDARPDRALLTLRQWPHLSHAHPILNQIHTRSNADVSANLLVMLSGVSSCFESWYWRVREDKGQYWLYETRASCKYPETGLAIMLIMSLQPCLLVEDGDIVYRELFQTAHTEIVLALDNNQFRISDGLRYMDTGIFPHPSDEKAPIDYVTGDYEQIRHQRLVNQDFEFPWHLKMVQEMNFRHEALLKKREDENPWGY